MKVIRKRPGELPEVIDVNNDLKSLQTEVGGHIEVVTVAEDLAIICDEEGRLKGKLPNVVMPRLGIDFVGTILIVGVAGEDFCDVPKLDDVLWSMFHMVRYTRADRKNNNWKCRKCGYMHQFEADGPYENGWNVCPDCSGVILRPVSNGGPA